MGEYLGSGDLRSASSPVTFSRGNAVAHYLARLSPGSRPSMLSALRKLTELLLGPGADPGMTPWDQLTYEHVNGLRTILAHRYAPKTANRHLAALRGVLKEAWRLGRLSADQYTRLSDIANVPGRRVPPGRALSREELARLFRVCASDVQCGPRDAALLAVLCSGLRVTEVATLSLEAFVGDTLRVVGKGDKERIVPLDRGATEALNHWIARRGPTAGPLLRAIGGGDPVGRHLSVRAIRKRCETLARRARIDPFSPHDLRRTCATLLNGASVDLDTIRLYLGHADARTTQGYLREEERRKADASRRLLIPYVGGEPCPSPGLPQDSSLEC